MNEKVLIIGGKFDGHTGQVLSSGNGWVQVQTTLGEVAKRAYELQVIGEGSSSVQNKLVKVVRAPAVKTESVPPQPIISNRPAVPIGRLRNQRERQNSITKDDIPIELPKSTQESIVGQKRSAPPQVVQVEKKVADSHSNGDRFTNNASNVTNTTTSRKYLKTDPFIVARRAYIEKFVAKQQQKIKSRPHISNWQYQMSSTIYSNASVIELNAAREFEESYCNVCCMEKWPGAKFCWNELCSISPIYYKLPREDNGPSMSPISPSRQSSSKDDQDIATSRSTKKIRNTSTNSIDESKKTSIYTFSEVQSNPVATFLREAPACILSSNTETYEEEIPYQSDVKEELLSCVDILDSLNNPVDSHERNIELSVA